MKKKTLILLFLTLTMFNVGNSVAQQYDLTDVSINFTNSQAFANKANCKWIVDFEGLTNIEKIEFNLGSTPLESNLINLEVNCIGSNSLPFNCSYSSLSGNLKQLVCDNIDLTSTFFAKVRVKNTSGVWSNYFEIVVN
ncbi:MAG: hypothetical protein IPJ86_15665 [Bacteroidetes bacterium]|nr:hypothetical protein [Bacteroidota bacterium]MBK9317653.1 hypothetical protein [Bacteroidota bacterium]